MKWTLGHIVLPCIVAAATAALVTAQLRPTAHAEPKATSGTASPKTTSHIVLREGSGGPVLTPLGYGIVLNKGSSLERAWFVADDPAAPVKFDGGGITTKYKSESYGSYSFVPSGALTLTRDCTALEVRFILFDIWGRHLKTLSGTEIKDRLAGSSLPLRDIGSWSAYENQASAYFASVAFLAKARFKDGTVWNVDLDGLIQKARAISSDLAKESLAPEKRQPESK